MSWQEDSLLKDLLRTLGADPEVARQRGVLLGPGDDAAVWQPDGAVVATVDSVVAGVDWLVDRTPAAAIGHRALAVNLSDLAAMGATPRGYLLALELPQETETQDVLAAAAGLRALANRHGAVVLGGDLGCSAGPARWTVTALGTLQGQLLRRDAARPGDRVWLFDAEGANGVGAAAAGLAVLQHEGAAPWAAEVIARHRWPQPQVAAGQGLGRLATPVAALDLSDGLVRDARRLAAASGVALELRWPRPMWLTPAVEAFADQHGLDWRQWVASGGDDYALLVAARPDYDLTVLGGLEVGRAQAGSGVALWVDGVAVVGDGYAHGGASADAAVDVGRPRF